jgi:hypothetical protein
MLAEEKYNHRISAAQDWILRWINGMVALYRYGSKTVFFVEGTYLKTEVLEALEEAPFVKKQFQKLADMYGVEIPKIKDYE